MSKKLEDGKIDPMLVDAEGVTTETQSIKTEFRESAPVDDAMSLLLNPDENGNEELTADNFDDGFGDEVTVGFAPYWKAHEGGCFQGLVLKYEEQDQINQSTGEVEKFKRYTIVASRPIRCQRGATDDPESVLVPRGGKFTITEYAGLPLREYMGAEIRAMVTGSRKMKDRKKEDMWSWRVKVDRESGRFLREQMAAHAYAMRQHRIDQAKEQIAKMKEAAKMPPTLGYVDTPPAN